MLVPIRYHIYETSHNFCFRFINVIYNGQSFEILYKHDIWDDLWNENCAIGATYVRPLPHPIEQTIFVQVLFMIFTTPA